MTKADAFVSNQLKLVCGIVKRESIALRKGEQCPKKKVKIYKFCIDGDDDVGANGEYQIRLNGNKCYPHSSSDCKQGSDGYCQ